MDDGQIELNSESDSHSENENESEVDQSNLVTEEIKKWETDIIEKYTYEDIKCTCCHGNNTLKCHKKKKGDIYNPFILGCSEKKCKKKYNLRDTFLFLNYILIIKQVYYFI